MQVRLEIYLYLIILHVDQSPLSPEVSSMKPQLSLEASLKINMREGQRRPRSEAENVGFLI